ncbi:MAG TPA: LamG-like jellyroll fold domain-containing protein [Sedimentisphaerales bacterium]|nr:LamG-like jellyroll fold domain-containing protein [Sedimentisphaerales bacterium]
MFNKLIILVSVVLILGLSGSTSAELIGRWKLDEGSGTTAADSVGNNDGTLFGDTSWAEGILDGALSFDGDGDYVDCGNDPIFNPSDSFSITLWAYINDWGDPWARSMIGKGGDQDRGGWSVRRFSDDTIDFCGAGLTGDGSGEGENHNMNSTTAPPLNEWFHIACVYDVNNMAYIYINGEVDRERATTGAVAATDAGVYLGTRGNTAGTAPDDWGASFFDGMLDDVRFYNHALEETELGPIMQGKVELPGPLAARPNPANGAMGVPMDTTLSWKPGLFADKHDVYLGTVFDDVNEASRTEPLDVLVSESQGELAYEPAGLLEFGRKYYWRVDEVNAPPEATVYKGDIWSFMTINYLIVDDFEDYNDYPPNDIFSTWTDGWDDPINGSTIGHENPDFNAGEHFVETTIVHGGEQAMPFFFDNSSTANYSEAERAFSPAQDWTRQGVTLLSLWFRGYPVYSGSFVEEPAGTYTMTGSGADIWDTSDEFHFAYKELTSPGSIIAKIESVEQTHDWAKAGVMLRDTLDTDSIHAMMIVSATQGVSFQRRRSVGGVSFATDIAGIMAPQWVKIERSVSGAVTASYSADGASWTQVGNEGMKMNIPMYIGLAVTAHNAGEVCEAKFSNVSITGTVSEQWTNQDIAILSNAPQPMYVTVGNGTGEPAVVYHEEPNATVISSWTEWIIPLQDFTDQGIDLTDVDNIAIGIGTKGDSMTPGGSGNMFFDEIRLYLPPEPEPAP